MDELEHRQRAAVVAEARSWLRTPYHHAACIKGVGVDCAMLLIGVFADVGLIERFTPAAYPPDWMHHRSAERYLAYVTERARALPADAVPLPGDVVLWKFGRCFSHGAIVVAWPAIIEARRGIGVMINDAERDRSLRFIGEGSGPELGKPRPRRAFTLIARL